MKSFHLLALLLYGLLIGCATPPAPTIGITPSLMPSPSTLPTNVPIHTDVPIRTDTAQPEPSPTPRTSPSAMMLGNPRHTLVGAIRWDAWVGEMATFGDAASDNRVGLVVERTLGPQKWLVSFQMIIKS